MEEGEKLDGVSPIVAVCCLVMLLSACIGGTIELAGGKGTRLWVIAGSPVLLSGAVVGIHMIVTKRAFYKSRDYVGRDAVVVGILFLLVFGSAFIFLVAGALWASP